jgi:hypothetical protein
MRILTGSLSFDLIDIGSKGELDGELNHCDRAIKLNYTLDPVHFHYIVSYFGTQQKHGIGLYSELSHFSPDMLIDEAAGLFWFGWDSWAVAVSISKFEIVSLNSLSADFIEFIPLKKLNWMLIEYQLGIVCLDSAGNLIWQFDGGDIITGLEIKEDRVVLQYYCRPSVSLRMDDGKEINGYWG